MLEEIRRRCPKAAKWADTCYNSSSHLFFGNNRLSSSSGAQQGDPLACLFFALVLQPLIERIKEECPDLLLIFFLDDGTIIGRRNDLQKVFDILSTEGPALGLHLNQACIRTPPSPQFGAAQTSSDVNPLAWGAPCAPTTGFYLLGGSSGKHSFLPRRSRGPHKQDCQNLRPSSWNWGCTN